MSRTHSPLCCLSQTLSSLLPGTTSLSLHSFAWHTLQLSSLSSVAVTISVCLLTFVCHNLSLCCMSVLQVVAQGVELGVDYTRTYSKIQPPPYCMSVLQVIAQGVEVGVDYTRTYSCMKGARSHCGTCKQVLSSHLKRLYIYIYIYIYICRDFTYEMYYDTDF
jgi:hypothetical protein